MWPTDVAVAPLTFSASLSLRLYSRPTRTTVLPGRPLEESTSSMPLALLYTERESYERERE